jgi:hypothetical protein
MPAAAVGAGQPVRVSCPVFVCDRGEVSVGGARLCRMCVCVCVFCVRARGPGRVGVRACAQRKLLLGINI